MKKKVVASLLAIALASPGLAMAESVYVKLGVNHTKAKVGEVGDGTATGGTIAIGMPINQVFDAEIGYLNFGRGDIVRVDGPTRTESQVKAQGFYLAGLAKLPLTESFGVFGKFGAIYAKTDLSSRDVDTRYGTVEQHPDESFKRWAPLAGLGISFRFSQQITAMLDYTYIHKISKYEGNDAKANVVTASLKYDF